MRKNIRKVMDAFVRRAKANGDSKRTCSTDGIALYSYSLAIARWEPDGWLWVASENGQSHTTRMQLRAIRAELREWIPCELHEDCCAPDNRALAIACVLDRRAGVERR